MNRKGVVYETGRIVDGRSWRPEFAPVETRRELAIIRDDLHCNAVKITGDDIGRVTAVAADALEQGLEAWLAPDVWDQDADATLDYIAEAARSAGELHRQWQGRVVLIVASELTFFLRGIVEGSTVIERAKNPALMDRIRSGALNASVNDFLSQASRAARPVFEGSITYGSLFFEPVDWTLFDFAGVQLYRDAAMAPMMDGVLRRLRGHNRPVIITEFGCCTYQGAADDGAMGWEVMEYHGRAKPPTLKGGYQRDETGQADELTSLLTLFDSAGTDGTFVNTFISPLNACNDDPRFDFDMASYSLVKSYGNRLGDVATDYPDVPWDTTPAGTTYPDMPWEPKKAFWAVAGYYATHASA
jgi:hypothetical protein